MRAMILAAGLGTRLRPLTDLCAKPALPVCGRPVISLLLESLAHQGVHEVMINLHHLPDTIRHAVEQDHPEGSKITWSEESQPLGTGGGLKRAAEFLRQDAACLVLAGDMLLDTDLRGLVERHLGEDREVTLLLRDDPRASEFGTIAIDETGQVQRIGRQAIRSPRSEPADANRDDMSHGLFTGVRVFSRRALEHWPRQRVFEDLRDWLIPAIETRGTQVAAEISAAETCVWEPVGTPAEYLRVNLAPPALPSLGGDVRHWQGAVERVGSNLIACDAMLSPDARIERCVVWPGERVAAGTRAHDGIFAGGHFFAAGAAAGGPALATGSAR